MLFSGYSHLLLFALASVSIAGQRSIARCCCEMAQDVIDSLADDETMQQPTFLLQLILKPLQIMVQSPHVVIDEVVALD